MNAMNVGPQPGATDGRGGGRSGLAEAIVEDAEDDEDKS